MIDPVAIKSLIEDSKHFCVLPWVHFHSWPDGKVMPCCVADSSKPVSSLKKDESIIQMINSDEYKQLRVSMLNDEPSEECKRCYDLEIMGTWTMRKSHNTRRGLDYVDYIVNNTREDGELTNFQMKYMDLRFSNMCNMKCRSCGPSCSSLAAQEFINNNGSDTYELYFNTSKAVINVAEEIGFVQKLKPYLKDTLEVYFAGGEIIITPEHYECLDYWIENNMNEEIELSYTTNLSTLNGYKDKNLIEYWKKFPKLQIYASIDAEGDVAEIIRKGTDWKKIIENIKIIKEQAPHAQFEFTPTISIWNIFNFHILFDFLVNEKLIDYKTANPRFNLATNPWYANIMILPSHIKHRLVKVYEGYVDRYHNINPNLTNGFLTIIHNLKTGSENKEGILEFKKNNDQYDAYRKEKLEDIIPELKEVYEWAEN
jgi:hypothetical protein